MSVIGIILNSNNIIEKENKLLDKNLIIINEDVANNFKNIKFDILIISEEMNKIEEIKEIVKNTKFLILNTDFKENLKLLDDIKASVITFGFNSKSTITIVSNENEEIILEIQREIENLVGKKVECQEIKLDNNYGKMQIYNEISMKILEILLKI